MPVCVTHSLSGAYSVLRKFLKTPFDAWLGDSVAIHRRGIAGFESSLRNVRDSWG